MKTVIMIVGWAMVAATALPLLRKDAWWVRMFDFPRAQILVLALLVLAVDLLVGDIRQPLDAALIVLLAVAVVYQAVMMYPYTPLARKQVQNSRRNDPRTRFSLMVANVLMDNRDGTRLPEIIREADPDLVLTLETDHWWAEQLQSLEADYPYAVSHVLDNTYGMMLFSRLKLIDPQVKFLIHEDVPSIHAQVELPSGDRIVLRCLHPVPPSPTEHERSTERDAELVIVGREVKALSQPVVVAGDMNDVAWSRTTHLFQNISGLLDPRIGRGVFSTFHARYPWLRWPLDHFFHSDHLRLVEIKRLPYFGSDHFPIYIALSLEQEAVRQQDRPQADGEDHEEGKEKVREAKAAN